MRMPMTRKAQTLQQAILLNNSGIAYFVDHGDFSNSLRSLGRGLVLLNQYVAQAQDHDQAQPQQPNTTVVPTMESYPITVQNDDLSSALYVCNDAMIIRSPEDVGTLDSYEVSVVVSVVLFNLGLVYHQQVQGAVAPPGGAATRTKLNRALYMYRASTNLLDQYQQAHYHHHQQQQQQQPGDAGLQQQQQQNLPFPLIKMLLSMANNQATICYEHFHDYNGASQHMNRLQDLYFRLRDNIIPESAATMTQEDLQMMEEIARNFQTLSSPPTTAPAA